MSHVRPELLAVSAGVTPPSPTDPPFMSYPSSSILKFTNTNNFVIENLSFENIPGPNMSDVSTGSLSARTNIAIELRNCDNVTIRRCDFRRVSEPVWAFDCDNLIIEECRYENILGPNHRAFGNSAGNYGNFAQFDNCNAPTVRDVKGRYGDFEDIISHFRSPNATVERFHHEGASSVTRTTSDGTPAIVPGWFAAGSWGGFQNGVCTPCNAGVFNACAIASTGVIFGDLGPAGNSVCRDSILLNAGRVPMHITGGANTGFDNCIGISTTYTSGMGGRTGQAMDQSHAQGASAFNAGGAGVCSSIFFTRVRNWYLRCDGATSHFWSGAGCGTNNTTGSTFGDATLDIDDWRVDLSTLTVPMFTN